MNNGNRIFGLRRNVFFLGLVSFFNDFSAEMVYAVMPAFLTTVLGAPPIFLGFMEGFVDAFASTFKIFSGWLSDKVGQRKWFAVSGYTLAVIARSFLSLVGNIWQVFSLRVVDRLGKGLRDSPRDALLSESVERVELGKSFGYHRAMDRAGAILGPIAAISRRGAWRVRRSHVFLRERNPDEGRDYSKNAGAVLVFASRVFARIQVVFVRDIRVRVRRHA
ncbi:MAG: MFS transporter [Candidatus Harrisonbacteria bacterium]|nr:MFS transporter [Candidatus Harrisonbacteria bacterium]